MILLELQVYKLKVSLFTHRFNESSGLFGTGRMVVAGSHCYFDQIADGGWAVCRLFGEECAGMYVKFPVDIADKQVEEVFDTDGKPEMIRYKDTT